MLYINAVNNFINADGSWRLYKGVITNTDISNDSYLLEESIPLRAITIALFFV